MVACAAAGTSRESNHWQRHGNLYLLFVPYPRATLRWPGVPLLYGAANLNNISWETSIFFADTF